MIQTYGRIIEIEVEQTEVQISKERKMDELLGHLNPRYFEEAMTPENALDKVHSMGIDFGRFTVRPF